MTVAVRSDRPQRAARRRPAVLAAAWLSLVAVPAFASTPAGGSTAAPAAASSVEVPLDLNTAGHEELLTLPRVGPVMARRILDYRKMVGAFKSVDELLNVKGIGESTLKRLRPLVTVGSAERGDVPGGAGEATAS